MSSPFPNLAPELRGTVHRFRHTSTCLEGNPWKDPTERDLYVHTPAGWNGETSLPAVMLLPGFTGTGEKYLARSLTDASMATTLDHLHADGCQPFAAVMPDVMSTLGGSQFVDSPAIGKYASYVADEIPAFVAQNLPLTGRWGAVGHSSGGFGAIHLAIHKPGWLSAIASHAGDMGFDLAYLADVSAAVKGVRRAGGLDGFHSWFWAQDKVGHDVFAAFNILGMAAAYSPDLSATPFPARLPVDFATGEVNFDVLASWRRFDPIVKVDEPQARQALQRLELLYLEAGKHDEYHLQLGLQRFVRKLNHHDIPHVHVEFDGGHRGLSRRYPLSLQRLATQLHKA
jgi:S-formylglutathione hydrolase FrmB